MPTFGRTWSSGRRCGHTPTRLYHRPLHKPHPMTALLLPYLLVLVQALVLVLVLTQVAEHLMLGAMKRLPLPCRRR